MSVKQALAAVKRRRRRVKIRTRQLKGARRKLEQAKQALARARASKAENSLWGGSRAVTNEVIRIVNGRARVTSRKRAASDPLSQANPVSDHNAANTLADAVDFGIAEAHSLKNEISRRLGGPNQLADFATFSIRRNGRIYRVQIIAGTHGTGPHLHVGVRRA